MGECFFWYRLTRVVPDKIQSHETAIVVVVVVVVDRTDMSVIKWYRVYFERKKRIQIREFLESKPVSFVINKDKVMMDWKCRT